MKKALLILITSLVVVLFFIIFILSTTGYETEKFNKIITDKIVEQNNKVSLELKKIKFKFDLKNFSLFLETKDPKLEYQSINIPLKLVKVYLDFTSLIKSKTKIDKMDISSKEINIDELKKIALKTKPSNLNSFIINKVKNGKLTTNLELYFDENLNIKNYIARGEVYGMEAVISDKFSLQETNFNFFADNSDVLIKNLHSEINGLSLKNGNVIVQRNKMTTIISNFSTNVDLNKNNVERYLRLLKNNMYSYEKINLRGKLNHNLNIVFDNTYKVNKYSYETKGDISLLDLKPKKAIKSLFLKNDIDNLSLKNSTLNFRYSSDKNNFINVTGNYQFNENDYQKFNFKNNFVGNDSKIELDIDLAEEFRLDIINYKKKDDSIAKISAIFKIRNDLLNFEKINYKENKNLISLSDFKIKNKDIISIKKIKIKTFNNKKLNNDFTLSFEKNIKINGTRYDATNLNKILNKKNKDNNLKKISKNIEIDLESIETPLSKRLKNFKLLGLIEKGKFVKISSKGDFGNNKFLDITLKKDKNTEKKYLEVYSDLPQPLLTEFNFFKGLSEGTLIYSSVIDGDLSNSKLIIENFKIINTPGVVKLLSLADFGGLADLAEGEGLSFEKLEINMTNQKNFLRLDELYAVGPSISVLMDGYRDETGLTSLRGTLVPAKNLNNLLSKIPVIGKIIIPKEVGEGLFGVSFKMKGPAGKIKTTINPIKTLTPRFITKALEKKKKSK